MQFLCKSNMYIYHRICTSERRSLHKVSGVTELRENHKEINKKRGIVWTEPAQHSRMELLLVLDMKLGSTTQHTRALVLGIRTLTNTSVREWFDVRLVPAGWVACFSAIKVRKEGCACLAPFAASPQAFMLKKHCLAAHSISCKERKHYLNYYQKEEERRATSTPHILLRHDVKLL